MSDNETVVETPDDLSAFEDVFYGRAKPEEKVEETEVVETDEAEDNSSDADTSEVEDHGDEADSTDESEDESEENEKPRRNRKTAKERIQELNYEKRLAEQRYQDALAQINELKSSKPSDEVKKEESPSELKAPVPDAVNDKGEPLYPLGEFDPAYIRDLTRHTIAKEQELAEKQRVSKAQEEELNRVRQERQQDWANKLDTVEEEIPDVRQKIASLGNIFENLNQSYGQYLVDTVQSLDNGVQILAYLADNPKEAKSIVNSGAFSATLALGRLDAKLAKAEETEKVVKVSDAPPPPTKTPRGTGRSAPVMGDTDDLAAFEKVFFKK